MQQHPMNDNIYFLWTLPDV